LVEGLQALPHIALPHSTNARLILQKNNMTAKFTVGWERAMQVSLTPSLDQPKAILARVRMIIT